MKPYLLTACIGLASVLAMPLPAAAQGVVRGAQEGATVGNRAAGPVGGAVGGAVGGVAGGVVGGVKGVLGIPQNTSTRHVSRHASRHAAKTERTGAMSQPTIRSALVGRPLHWTNADGTQSGTTVFYTDGTSVLTNSNLATGPDDQGRWSFKGNRLCVTWDKLNPSEEKCSTWTRTGPDSFRDSDGMIVKKPDVG